MGELMGGRAGKHGAPPKDCNHHGTVVKKRGSLRCSRCWRVCSFLPGGPVWHYGQRKLIPAQLPGNRTI